MVDALWPVCHGLIKVVRGNAPGRVWPMRCSKVHRHSAYHNLYTGSVLSYYVGELYESSSELGTSGVYSRLRVGEGDVNDSWTTVEATSRATRPQYARC